MLRVRWLLLGFLLLPVAELAVFLAVAAQIGVLAALSIILATSLLGAMLLRDAGRGMPVWRGRPVKTGSGPGLAPGLFRILAGVLLLVPGFLTDLAGGLLLLPAVQRRLVGSFSGGMRQRGKGADDTIELDPAEWQRIGEHERGETRASDSCRPATTVLATPPQSGSSASRRKEEP
jgi:UPF0716 protein FxsA